MISSRESSERRHPPAPESDIESIGGFFHPHSIEVQDFGYYALVLDLRTRVDYERDHIPGAVHFECEADPEPTAGVMVAHEPSPLAYWGSPLEPLLSRVKPGRRVLIYCSSGSPAARTLAASLIGRGFAVDVLPAGWNTYRRWVRAGLALLPRVVSWRVIGSPLGCEVSRVLERLRKERHQVLDLQRLAGWTIGSMRPSSRQPHQEAFETAIVDGLRHFSAQRPVWTAFVPRQLGALTLPTGLADLIAISPLYRLEVPLPERLRLWRASDAAGATEDQALVATLKEELEPEFEAQVSSAGIRRPELPVLAVESFESGALSAVIRAWLGHGSSNAPA